MTDHKRRTVLKTAGSVAIIGGLAGCAGDNGEEEPADPEPDVDSEEPDEDEPEEMAGVRVAHLSPDAPNVDVYVDGDAVLEDVPFRTVSDYLELPAGEYDIEVTAAGDAETVVFDETVAVDADDYTLAALGELADENQPFEVATFVDDLSDPGDDARVRVVHASPDAPNVDVTAGDGEVVLIEDLAFGEEASFEVPADTYTIEVRPATDDNDGDVAAEFEGVEVEAGVVYSAFAVGYLVPEDAPADEPFDLDIVVDADHDE